MANICTRVWQQNKQMENWFQSDAHWPLSEQIGHRVTIGMLSSADCDLNFRQLKNLYQSVYYK